MITEPEQYAGQSRADAQQRRKRDALEQLPAMEVDFVGKPRITRAVGGGQIVDLNRTAIGQDDPLPDQQGAPLQYSVARFVGDLVQLMVTDEG